MSIADKLTTIAENEQKVYDKGVEDGKKSEYDRFWDDLQENGNRRNYHRMFTGCYWTKDTFKPKYKIVFDATSESRCAEATFHYMNRILGNSYPRDAIDFSNIDMDCSLIKSAESMFANSGVMNVTCDLSSATNVSRMFQRSDGGYINFITLTLTEKCTLYTNAFQSCSTLTTLTITDNSVIAATLDMSYAPLTAESAKSIINALKNYAGTNKELTYKLTLKSTTWAALNEVETPPTGETWQEHVNNLGWNYG